MTRVDLRILSRFATPEEKARDADQYAHEDGFCAGPPHCIFCVEEETERRNRKEEEALRADQRTKDLLAVVCRKCEFWCAGRSGHSGPCFEMYSHRDTCPGKPDCVHDDESDRELWQQLDQLGKDTDALKRLQTNLERMFPASGVGPRTKMRRFENER